MKESAEDFISFLTAIKLQRSNSYKSFFHKELFALSLPYFIMGIVILRLVNGLLPYQELHPVP